MIAGVGRMFVDEARGVVSYATLAVLVVQAALRRPGEGAKIVGTQIARQIVFSAWDAVGLVALIAALMTVTIIAMMVTLAPAIDTPEMLGGVLATALVRELAPIATAVIVSARSCSAVTVELGYMSWRGEVEALETNAIDPAKFILLPRFVGLTVALVGLTLVFVITVFTAGAAGVSIVDAGSSLTHLSQHLYEHVTMRDFGVAGIKALVFGQVIAAVACYHGLSVRRDITQVPRRTTRALVEVLVHCAVFNAIITVIAL